MSPISLPAAIVGTIIPNFSGPTAWLLSGARACALNQNSPAQRAFWSRACCIAAVATAALELIVHTTLFAATIPMIAAKRCIWMSLILSSYVFSGLFGLIHGNSIRLDLGFWLKFILIHVILLLRHPSVLFNHFKVWGGLAGKHSELIIHITSLALNVESGMSHYFSSNHLQHHAEQAFQLGRYTLAGIPAGLWNPGTTAKRAMQLGLGPTKPPSLISRAWRQLPSGRSIIGWVLAKSFILIGQHWVKIGVLLAIYAVNKDYRAFISAPGTWPHHVVEGLLFTVRKVAETFMRNVLPFSYTHDDMMAAAVAFAQEMKKKSSSWF